MTRLSMRGASLAFMGMLTLAGPMTIVLPRVAIADGGSTVCTSVPAKTSGVLEVGVATAEDIQAFHKAVAALQVALNTLCKQDQRTAKRLQRQAKSVAFEMSAGATEPTAYLKDDQLVVEFYGGSFDARSFQQLVKQVLRGQAIPHND